MPIYDFKCETCGITEERLAKTRQSEVFCKCGSDVAMKKVYTPTYVTAQFKGNGYYCTDFKNK